TGLQLVVTVDAALLARQGRIDRAEDDLALERDETRLGLRFRRLNEMLDCQCHIIVGRRGGDLATGCPNHDKAQRIYGISVLVEALDRVCTKACRYRSLARQEF